MASELDLTTLGEVRAWLGFKAATVEHDADLERLISACSTTIQKLIGRNVLSAAYNHFQDGNGATFMVVRNSPIVRVANVVIDGRPVDPLQVSFDGATLYLSGGLRFNRGRHNIQLRYTAGYDEVPADLAQVCIETVGLRWRERDRIGQTSKSLAGETTSFSLADFSPTARTVIGSYTRVAPV
jgi:hypothetical protein